MIQTRVSLTAAITLILGGNTFAADAGGEAPPEILVFGSDFNLSGTPLTAAEGIVYDTQLELRPVSRTAELLEFVPGLIATQHSGEGKANQYFVRGFNLDHGTDFALRLDDMPINMPTHGHGQGYADINFIIPELVDRLNYRKGPYYADGGDFATAGSAEFSYADSLDQGMINLTLGENNYGRLFLGESFDLFSGQLTLAGAITQYGGPWERDQNLDKRKAVVKYHETSSEREWSLTGMTYLNDWDSTDQIPLRAVENGSLSRWGNIDPTVGGDSRRNSLSFAWQENLSADDQWNFSAYVMDYTLDLYSNFTYFANDPIRGDQFRQADDRQVAGFETEYRRSLQTSIPTEITLGFQNRYDDIEVGLYLTEQREVYDTVRADNVEQSLNSLYASVQHQWTDRFRSVASVRADHYAFDVTAGIAANGGSGSDTLFSPKLNLIFGPIDGLETFFSAGQGFHSNDARGTVITVDPVTGDPIDSVDPLATARSYEAGLRTSLIPKTQIALTAFSMRLSSELIYVGDAGNTEAVDASQRHGVELNGLYSPTDWLLFDADVSYTKARLRGVGADNRIGNAVENTASLGMIVDDLNNWSGGIRLRYLGEAPLTEARLPRSESTFLMNAQTTYNFTPNLSLTLELLNVLDSDDRDITYFYESQLPGEASPVEDIHFHPVEPRSVRMSIQARF
ncbi:MAG: TonB-dependent receptor [Pseudohongiella sp.]|uniref:TonB-dependent receptor n=1 Tax=Pseudohongiella sp. TaxID=1979412 RepID=UPI00349FED11